MSRLTKRQTKNLIKDGIIISFSIIIAVLLLKTNVLGEILKLSQGIKFIESVIAGMFFTSAFTTVPAIAFFGQISHANSIFFVAFFGAFGAMLGDIFIFKFIKNKLAEDLAPLIGKTLHDKLHHIFEMKLFRWISPLVGVIVIASPLPDEMAITFLGIVKTNTFVFIIISFIANFTGILIIAAIARLAVSL